MGCFYPVKLSSFWAPTHHLKPASIRTLGLCSLTGHRPQLPSLRSLGKAASVSQARVWVPTAPSRSPQEWFFTLGPTLPRLSSFLGLQSTRTLSSPTVPRWELYSRQSIARPQGPRLWAMVMQDGALRGVPSQHVPMFLVAPTPKLLGKTHYYQASWTSHNPLSTPTIPHQPQSRPTPRPTAAGTPPPALPFTYATLTSPISYHQVTCPPLVLPTLPH